MDEYYKTCKCPDCVAKRFSLNGGLYGPVVQPESSEDCLKRFKRDQDNYTRELQVLAKLKEEHIEEDSKECLVDQNLKKFEELVLLELKKLNNPKIIKPGGIIYKNNLNIMNSPSDEQIGGDHYKNFKIQPSEFIHKNNLSWCEGNVIKYICRHQFKNGAEDIKKAIHYLQLILQWVYNEKEA